MSRKLLLGAVAPVLCLMLSASSAQAQSPTSYAENSDEYYAYVHTYIARVQALGLANTIDEGVPGQVSELVSSYVNDAFFHCYYALMRDDDNLWLDASDDLNMALYWTDTMLTYAQQNNEPNTVIQQIRSLQWRIELAIDRCEAAGPPQFWIIIWPINWP